MSSGGATIYGLFSDKRVAVLAFIGMVFALVVLFVVSKAAKDVAEKESKFYDVVVKALVSFIVVYFIAITISLFPALHDWLTSAPHSTNTQSVATNPRKPTNDAANVSGTELANQRFGAERLVARTPSRGNATHATPAKRIAQFQFNGSLTDSTGHNPPAKLTGNARMTDALVDTGTQFEIGTVDIPVENLNYDDFTIAWEFNPRCLPPFSDAPQSHLLTGGFGWRILGFDQKDGLLNLRLNNFAQSYSLDVQLKTNTWQSIVCAVDIPAKQIRVLIDGVKFKAIDLPASFQLGTSGLPIPASEKTFGTANGGTGNVFLGQLRNVIVFDRGLTESEMRRITGAQ